MHLQLMWLTKMKFLIKYILKTFIHWKYTSYTPKLH
jgi:hypothetical protein